MIEAAHRAEVFRLLKHGKSRGLALSEHRGRQVQAADSGRFREMTVRYGKAPKSHGLTCFESEERQIETRNNATPDRVAPIQQSA